MKKLIIVGLFLLVLCFGIYQVADFETAKAASASAASSSAASAGSSSAASSAAAAAAAASGASSSAASSAAAAAAAASGSAVSGASSSSSSAAAAAAASASNPVITCSNNAQCGTNSLTGGLFCQDNSVYQNYITYICNNPGTTTSYCTNPTIAQLQSTCLSGQTCSNGSCTNSCTQSSQQRCVGNSLYWYDSCNVQQGLIQYCPNGCVNNACQNNLCTQSFQQRCNGNNLYWYDSCGNIGSLIQYCANGCVNNACQTNICTQSAYQRCNGNNLYWYDSCGNVGSLIQYCANGCVNNACQGSTSNGTLTMTKTVRNLTSGSGWSTSATANPSDTLMFMITMQAQTQDAQNVMVRDNLPANLIYNNQLVVACTSSGAYNSNCNNNNYNYSGNIASGVNLSTIYAGQTVTITYQAQLAAPASFAYGTSTLTNNAYATSSNSNGVSGSASVLVTRSAVYGASTIATGLTNNFWLDSFILPLIIILLAIWMWKSGIFFGLRKLITNKR